ncbi:iron-containing alcohol dehydrogenase [Spirochaeta isovalerica]|uniref:NADP-dependent alcohol dehydrogenase n=1 Tax=Spirochaeta isovalerica TaxID=150 RepID=A0A841RE78_9SPIO|nr:iron-containing alcohol dehydrogenase [Spirochaeta isovalerica]MBB6482375.1 NADP-dependent alcohol dehydrogenase [Spirochaeta isovalerica]
MKNFQYYNPVRVVFGKGTIRELKKLLRDKSKILFLYGGGSIKKNGVYDQVVEALKGKDFIEYSGIQANPDYEDCMNCVLLAEKENVDFILSVGGGSVLDAAKFIAAAIYYEGGEPWEILIGKGRIKKALPLGSVLTLPATGSEMNANSVISRREIGEKRAFSSPHVYPEFSILDPETTYSLSKRQVANGIVDAWVHVLEQYMTTSLDSPLQDRQAEAVLLTLLEEGPKAVLSNKDYEVQANIMWCSTNALNGLIGCGVDQDWATHGIGHELTALYGIDHARTLAVVLPGLLSLMRKQKEQKLLQYAERIWGISMGDTNVRIDEAIARTCLFFESLGVDTRYSDLGIDEDAPEKIAARIDGRNEVFGEGQNIRGPEIIKILKNLKD